ncbi:hypothetical protein PIB30_068868 [Stylosanthes scabra]|uniref:Uncharacterized protein n=1 Tax=Stylosanthes scabra TaxID=79078 RepID=A0ABU6VN87_9FABA|nr:hypothetical protein [Stylosanthes scabra]
MAASFGSSDGAACRRRRGFPLPPCVSIPFSLSAFSGVRMGRIRRGLNGSEEGTTANRMVGGKVERGRGLQLTTARWGTAMSTWRVGTPVSTAMKSKQQWNMGDEGRASVLALIWRRPQTAAVTWLGAWKG